MMPTRAQYERMTPQQKKRFHFWMHMHGALSLSFPFVLIAAICLGLLFR